MKFNKIEFLQTFCGCTLTYKLQVLICICFFYAALAFMNLLVFLQLQPSLEQGTVLYWMEILSKLVVLT
jgi:hypothetical protein